METNANIGNKRKNIVNVLDVFVINGVYSEQDALNLDKRRKTVIDYHCECNPDYEHTCGYTSDLNDHGDPGDLGDNESKSSNDDLSENSYDSEDEDIFELDEMEDEN